MPRTGSLWRIAVWLALAASVGLALLFMGVRATTPSDGARISFYGEGWSAAGVRIDPIDEPAPGLEDGDLVVAIGGVSAGGVARRAARPGVRSSDVDAPTRYAIVRDDAPLRVDVTWAVPAIGATLLAGWSVVLFSVAVAAVAAFVFARRPDEPAAVRPHDRGVRGRGQQRAVVHGRRRSATSSQGAPFLLHALVTGPLYMLLWPAGAASRDSYSRDPCPSSRAIGGSFRRSTSLCSWLRACDGRAGADSTTDLELGRHVADRPGRGRRAGPDRCAPPLRPDLSSNDRPGGPDEDPLGLAWRPRGGTIGLFGYMLPELILHRPLLPASWIGLTALPLPLGLAAAILLDHLFDIDVVVRRTFVYGGLTLGVVAELRDRRVGDHGGRRGRARVRGIAARDRGRRPRGPAAS